MKFLISLLSTISIYSYGAKCTRVEGDVKFGGQPVAVGMDLAKGGDLITGADGKAVVLVSEGAGKSEVSVSPDSILKIQPGEAAQAYLLMKGILRARLHDKAGKNKFSLRTNSAVMGVRGTDFMAVYNPLLGESEIVVFEGRVLFSSAKNPKDAKEVGAGYWGGIGGRYTQKVGDLIKLPAPALAHFQNATAF